MIKILHVFGCTKAAEAWLREDVLAFNPRRSAFRNQLLIVDEVCSFECRTIKDRSDLHDLQGRAYHAVMFHDSFGRMNPFSAFAAEVRHFCAALVRP